MKLIDSEDKIFKSLGACAISAFCGTLAWIIPWAIWQRLNAIPKIETLDTREIIFVFGKIILYNLGISTAFGVFGFFILSFFGLPVHAVLQRFRLNGYIWHVLSAALFGALVLKCFSPVLYSEAEPASHEIYILGGVLGFLYATIFWLIRRPDLDNKSSNTKPVTPTAAS